ncbi:hypothetical protein BGZ82_010088 [Podila clonocystis]|nr:hypothetical protein BGZ82_010088 [Podila clonocystis]
MPIPEEPPKRLRTNPEKASKKDKKKKPTKAKKVDKKPKDRFVEIPDDQSRNVLTMPNLQQVLEKKTSFPLGYDDFEAFLRTHRAAEYLNFWADVTAHEQLCRTFDVSERRQMRELQLEERAIARDKRRAALLQHPSYHTDNGQDLNNSNLYFTSRSSLQLPLADHLSFPAENRRYGLQDSTSTYAPPTRRQTFDQHSSGAYNKLLAGVESGNHGRRSSMDRMRTSMDRHVSTSPFSSQHHFGPPSSSSTPTSYNQMMRKRGSTDILAGTKVSIGENRGGDLRRSASQQQMSCEPRPNTLDEIAKLTQAVEESIQLSLANSDSGASPLSVLEPNLFREPSTFDQGIGPLQTPLAIRRSVDGPKPIIATPQEPKTLLVQSYRTIGLEDVQDSALRIYRKFLIQLRTTSMAAEEAASSSKRASSAPGPRGSIDGVTQRWDSYAEQVIAEWNEKWLDCGSEARRLRRLSGRTGVSERGGADHHEDVKDEKHQGSIGSKESGSEQGLSEEQMARDEAAKRRSGIGFTAFLNRLLRTETTVLELPTLTINTTTVEEEAASDESEDSGDEEEDYDSDIDDDDEDEEEEEVEVAITRKDVGVPEKDSELALRVVTTTQPKEAETIGGSTAADSRRSSAVSRSSCDHTSEQELEQEDMTLSQPVAAGPIRKSSLKKRDQTWGIRSKTGKVMPVTYKIAKPGPLAPMLKQGRRTSVSSMDTLNPLGSPKVDQPSFLASLKATGGSVVLSRCDKVESGQEPDLEKVLEEGRTEAPHLFGPAKGFVVEIVLRDHYYPLFLEHVQQQNLGISGHHASMIRKRGMLGIGSALWVVVVAAQLTFVLVGLGGWASPWVWVVGLLGGWTGSVCLVTGILGFSPILGLVGQIAEDRHVWRFRKTVDPSMRTLHFRRSVWILTYCVFWSSVVMVIFAALPAKK